MSLVHELWDGPEGTRIVLSGEIDFSVHAELRGVLDGAVAAARHAIDVDFHDVTFLDCSGIGECMRGYLAALAVGSRMTVSRPRGIVACVLELTGVLAALAADRTGDVAI